VKIWDNLTGKELFALGGHHGPVRCVAFSPDGRHLASGGNDQTVSIWDAKSREEVMTLKGHTGIVSVVAFSPDGRRLASGGWDQMVKIWDATTGKELFSLKGHFAKFGTGMIHSLAFSPDGRRLASGSRRSGTKIWDCVTGKELLSFPDKGTVMSLAFSPDGQCLASAEGDSLVLRDTVISPEMQQRRQANALVGDLFGQLGFRADVLESLRKAHGLSPAVRREALASAEAYAEDAFTFNQLAWEQLKTPGKEMADYRKGLRYSEAACRLEPNNGDYVNTLGVAHYRLGNNEKALELLQRSDKIRQTELKVSVPEDLAFLAMAHHRLSHAKEAQAYLQQLRERMKDPRWARNAEAQGFLREAEELIEGKPADKKK
jgi:hypothetical protein